MKKIRIRTGNVVKEALLNDSATAHAIWDALPIGGRVNRWGNEIYFTAPVRTPVAPDARDEVQVGDLAYWAPGESGPQRIFRPVNSSVNGSGTVRQCWP